MKKDNRLRIEIAPAALEILGLIQGDHGDNPLTLSEAVNLVAQLAGIVGTTPLRLSAGDLLYCCDILNGGASLTEFKTPDAVSIRQALEGMKRSLEDGLDEPGILEKWDITAQPFITKLHLMDEPELFALAMATRQFWSDKAMGKIKPAGDCENYQEWAAQWVEK